MDSKFQVSSNKPKGEVRENITYINPCLQVPNKPPSICSKHSNFNQKCIKCKNLKQFQANYNEIIDDIKINLLKIKNVINTKYTKR